MPYKGCIVVRTICERKRLRQADRRQTLLANLAAYRSHKEPGGRDQRGIDVSQKLVLVFEGYAGSWTDRTPRILNRLIAEHKGRIANTEFGSTKQLDRLHAEI